MRVDRPMDSSQPSITTQRIEITGPLERADVEILQLEIRRLAKLQGVEVGRVTIELICDESFDVS